MYSYRSALLMKTLRDVDLGDNLYSLDAYDKLQEASRHYHWQGLLQVRGIPQLKSRGPTGPFGRSIVRTQS